MTSKKIILVVFSDERFAECGLGCSSYHVPGSTFSPSPIGVMDNVHTAATIKEFISLESHTIEMPWVNDLVKGIPKPIIQNGVIPVPDSPGLGIEFIDEVAEKYLREPKYLAYKSGLFNPTPEFDKRMTMLEAKEKGLIGGYHQSGGPWWHINDEGVYANQTGSN